MTLDDYLHDPDIRLALEYGDRYEHPDGEGCHRELAEAYLSVEPNPDKRVMILMLMGHAIDQMDPYDVGAHFGNLIAEFAGADEELVEETPLMKAFNKAMEGISLSMLREGVAEAMERTDSENLASLQETQRLVAFANAKKPRSNKLN